MKKAIVKLKSCSPLSQSKFIDTDEHPKLDKELSCDFEKRIWRERIHRNDDGYVIIPPMVFKNCIAQAAKFLNRQVPGKGKSTYTKHFLAGILVLEPMTLGLKVEDVGCNKLMLDSNGVKNSGKRVMKFMPVIPQWEGEVEFHILDEIITKDIFTEVLREAGKFIGIGTFRPINGGYFGRFEVLKVNWI